MWTSQDVRQSVEDVNGPFDASQYDATAAEAAAAYLNANEYPLEAQEAAYVYDIIMWVRREGKLS